MVEAVARAIEPETFEKPRINLYGDLYERAFARARRAIEAVAALSAAPASAQMCPIGLDDVSEICSAGYCLACTVRRLEHYYREAGTYEGALKDIASSDDIENALDPARNKRIAARALRESLPTAGGE